MPQLFSALRVLGRHTVMKSAVARASLAPRPASVAPTVGGTLPLSMFLRNRILDHWYEFRPTLVRDLERSGELAAVVAALEQTILEKQAVMLKKGLSLEQADKLLRPMWMISDDDS